MSFLSLKMGGGWGGAGCGVGWGFGQKKIKISNLPYDIEKTNTMLPKTSFIDIYIYICISVWEK